MLQISLIAMGNCKEAHFRDACKEYQKRLSSFCTLTVIELSPRRIANRENEKELANALCAEGKAILEKIPSGAYVVPLCVEGKTMDSIALSAQIVSLPLKGFSKVCFVIGSSHGLANEVKQRGNLKLSLSPLTLPHELARVVLLEQLYRAFCIAKGTKYHK
mgnify:CR=1 FL=1